MQRGVKPQFKYADKIKAKNVITIGDSELERGEVNLKNMQNSEQTLISLNAEANSAFIKK